MRLVPAFARAALLVFLCSTAPPVAHALPAQAPLPQVRSMLVIGDSISLGYGAGEQGPDCGKVAGDLHRPDLSYAVVVARRLNARLELLAYSGRGLVHNYGKGRAPTIGELVTNRAIKEKVGETVPDVVIIHVGTNDFHQHDARAKFTPRYGALIDQLRSLYPHALIVGMFGPMLEGEEKIRAQEAIRSQINQRAAAGDRRLVLFLYGADPRRPDRVGCDWHPNAAAHEDMAEELIALLRALPRP
jgi:lysophospholipase L1-like esterase